MNKHAINPAYNKSLPMMARLEARAEVLGTMSGAMLDAELLLDARSVINDLLAAAYDLLCLAEVERNVRCQRIARDAIARAEGGAK